MPLDCAARCKACGVSSALLMLLHLQAQCRQGDVSTLLMHLFSLKSS